MASRSVQVFGVGKENALFVQQKWSLTDLDIAVLILADALFYNEENNSWQVDESMIEQALRASHRIILEEN